MVDELGEFLAGIAGRSEKEDKTFAIIGRFIYAFSNVENIITLQLAKLTRAQNINHFELLIRGMDARVKCERLRKILKLDYEIGPNFHARLLEFENNIIPLRNKIVHRWQLVDDKDHSVVHLATIAEHPLDPVKPPKVSRNQLRALIYWLTYLGADLTKAAPLPSDPKAFEIETPQTLLPPEDNFRLFLEGLASTTGKHSRIALALLKGEAD